MMLRLDSFGKRIQWLALYWGMGYEIPAYFRAENRKKIHEFH